MNVYETTATVKDHGQIHVAGLPFEEGTEVEITIKPAENGSRALVENTNRAARLLEALDKARNTEPVGPLRREDLYDREVFR